MEGRFDHLEDSLDVCDYGTSALPNHGFSGKVSAVQKLFTRGDVTSAPVTRRVQKKLVALSDTCSTPAMGPLNPPAFR
jgi:hypothetical protein